ncbi:MAG TPA: HupE/UreJ family protein [Azospirillum sp.]
MTPARRTAPAALALTLLLAASPALAHTGHADAAGLAHGFLHPVTGLDHLLAMVTVGVYAAVIGGRALVTVPLAFVAMMAAGAALGVAGAPVPLVEPMIAASVVVLGLPCVLPWGRSAGVGVALAGWFALFHGFAHGAEMPVDASALAYGAGFLAATALLHAAGLGLGLLARRVLVGRAAATGAA